VGVTALEPIDRTAVQLFAPIARNYERWSAVLSLGQDPRWRAEMVAGLDCPPRSCVLDVAAGTGLITRLLEQRGHRVVSLDVSQEMLAQARLRDAVSIRATADALPFASGAFDALTFSYLLRYVSDPAATMRELARVVRPGGRIGMLEFGRPSGIWRAPWWLYTRVGLPVAGLAAGAGWPRVGAFLGPSIDAFHRRWSPDALRAAWRTAGFTEVRVVRRSLGGGLLMWGTRE
jgi:demethylmenaquinone methyltransferase/2-methoxy-6-polyprenyl-1,4-benzoquinol methylase